MPDKSDHDALNEQFPRWQKIGKFGILSLEEGLRVFDEVALQRGLTVNERGNDIAWPWFANFENDKIAIADEGTNHRLTAHL